ncbi:lipopolysaccharide-induced tumor necrosis factor-alpha factor homolog [Mytilus trossulus]|uniref:lipopolysaccharide-induced tumor necrosis factor-alpha factor homolog n=1 Tax=Mytilus trossulus TaxID=6551 RepID=UPI003004FB5D
MEVERNDFGIFVHRRVSFTEIPSCEIIIFSKYSIHTKCRFCSLHIMTSLKYEAGKFAWLICLAFFLSGCWLGCCIAPCFIKSCKDVIHICPDCSQVIGRYQKL